MTEAIIATNGLCKTYGELQAVDQLNLRIRKGEIYGLLGPNGAGKTTTILMLLGLSEPSSGDIQVAGVDPVRNPLEVKRKVGYLPDNVGFYEDMTGFENLMFTARLNGIDPETAEQTVVELMQRVGLSHSIHQKAGTFSRGMRQRLGLADVLVKRPEIIILDEPTLGIDPQGINELLEMIFQLSRKDGLTVLLSSHLLHQVQKICDRVGLFVGGRLLAEGSLAELTQQVMGGTPWMIDLAWRSGSPIGGSESEESIEDQFSRFCHGQEDVVSLEREGEHWLIHCRSDLRASLCDWLWKQGAILLHLSIRSIGLDEIYARYFKGDEEYGGKKGAALPWVGAHRS